jgi:flagellar basal body-associated protein FliL
MSTTTQSPAAPAGFADSTGKKSSGWFWKAVVLGLILAVIGAECLFAFVYVTVATDKATSTDAAPAKHDAHAAHGAAKEHGAKGEHGATGEEGETGAAEHEIDMGEFSLSAFQPTTNKTLLVNFHLYGTILAADQHVFDQQFEESKHRVRDQVITTIRAAELADMTDPGLGLIKRQILEKTNRAFGRPLLQGVVFSDFLVVEQ